MAVTTLQQPSELDLAYGPVIVTLGNIDAGADKYAVRVLDSTGTQVGFVTQSPNEVARAQFDIRNIVQSLVKSAKASDEIFDSGTILRCGGPEIAKYEIEVGVELNGVFGDFINGDFTPNGQTSLGEFVIMNGTKPYYARDWYNIDTQYLGIASGDETADNCTQFTEPFANNGRILTDSPSNAQMSSNLVPGWPTPTNVTGFGYCNVLFDRTMPWNLSWVDKIERSTTVPPVSQVQGIEAFEIQEFDVNQNLLVRTFIPNIVANGGGPNTTFGQGQAIQFPYNVITIDAGYFGLQGKTYTDIAGATQTFYFNNATKFYFIIPRAYTPTLCDNFNLTTNCKRWAGFYVNKSESDCLLPGDGTDPETQNKLQFKNLSSRYGTWRNNANSIWSSTANEDPVSDWTLFSWLNSFGYRDYWYFWGERAIKITTKQDTFKGSHNDFNAALWDVPGDSRGETVFASEMDKEITVKSGYFPKWYWGTPSIINRQDFASTLMQSLYSSSDVRVWMNGHQALDYLGDNKKMHNDLDAVDKWEPVIITNKQYDFKQSLKDGKLYQYEISFKLANGIEKQSGESAR